MPSVRLVAPACGVLALSLLIGCSVDTEQQLVGKWKGDDSAVGVAIKAAKMKADNPDVKPSTATTAARAMGATTLTLNQDKTCALFMGGSTVKGKWAYVKEESLVELILDAGEIPPENQEQNSEGVQSQQYIVLVSEGIDKLEVVPLPMARNKWLELKEMMKGKKIPSLIALRK